MIAQVSPPVFSFQSHQIRTAIIDEQPWFVAKDVCAALGIQWTGKFLSNIPNSWQGVRKLLTPSGTGARGGGNQTLRIISEPAVYKLAFRSNKPEAEAFTDWVASEVLPAIRKTGRYEVPQPALLSRLSLPVDEERRELHALISTWVSLDAVGYASAWRIVNAHLHVKTINHATIEQVKMGIAYVRKRLAGLQKALPPALSPVQAKLEALRVAFASADAAYVDAVKAIYIELSSLLPQGAQGRAELLDMAAHLTSGALSGSVQVGALLKLAENAAGGR